MSSLNDTVQKRRDLYPLVFTKALAAIMNIETQTTVVATRVFSYYSMYEYEWDKPLNNYLICFKDAAAALTLNV